MSNGRSVNWLRLGAIIALLAGLALGSFWLLEVLRRSGNGPASPLRPGEPDYTIEKFHIVRMSQTGEAHYDISGAKLTHYPDKDSFEIQRPVFHTLDKAQAPLTVHAARAVVDNINDKVHMYNDVQVDRPQFGANEHFHLASEYLLILPDDDVMQTNKAVDIRLGRSVLTGVGMFANNATRAFRLSGNVRGSFQAPLR